jgi:hypothetical protein
VLYVNKSIKSTNLLYRRYYYTEMNQKITYHCIITVNSSKLSKPSPSKSKCLIIALHSSIDLDSPIFLSILFKFFGVINPHYHTSQMHLSNPSTFVPLHLPPSKQLIPPNSNIHHHLNPLPQ